MTVFDMMNNAGSWSIGIRIDQMLEECGSLCSGSADNDGDGIIDENDNCPDDSNDDQADSDSDGIGDACDDCSNISGDINDDSIHNILDIINVVNIILSGGFDSPDFNDCELADADLNIDGNINILDIIALVNLIVGNDRVYYSGENKAEVIFAKNGNDLSISINAETALSGVQISFVSNDLYQIELDGNPAMSEEYSLNNGIHRYLAFSYIGLNFLNDQAEITIKGGAELNLEDIQLTLASADGEEIPAAMNNGSAVFQTGEYGFELNSLFPNPFNPVTEINYTVPADGLVKLVAYDLKGQETAVLFSGNQTMGQHSMIWNAANLPSGIYYIQLQSENLVSEIQKAVLVK